MTQSRHFAALAFIFTLSPVLAPALLAQEYLHYKFESNCFGSVINYAQSSPAPDEGTISSTLTGAPASSWIPGQFGTALAGASLVSPATYNFVDTGWNPGTITGDMTWAMWMQMDPAAPTPGLTYLFGNATNFRVFTGGGGFLLTAGWGGSNVNTVANVQTLARAGWTHVACVLDSTALTGTYYINGVPEPPVVLSGPVNWTGTSFFVGRHSSLTSASIFDMDEFMLVGRAMSAAEIANLVSGPLAADGAFGTSCGTTQMDGIGQRPSLGNASYAFQISGAPAATFAFVTFGDQRCSLFSTFPLPTDLGQFEPQLAGCSLFVDNNLGTVSQFLSGGTANFAFPLPNLANLVGYTIYGETITFDLGTSTLSASNALAISIGL